MLRWYFHKVEEDCQACNIIDLSIQKEKKNNISGGKSSSDQYTILRFVNGIICLSFSPCLPSITPSKINVINGGTNLSNSSLSSFCSSFFSRRLHQRVQNGRYFKSFGSTKTYFQIGKLTNSKSQFTIY